MFSFKRFPCIFSIGTLGVTSCVTSHKINRTLSLIDGNKVNCGIYDMEKSKRSLLSVCKEGRIHERHREVVINVVFICFT